MPGQTDPLMTAADYLTFEERASERHEFFQGRVFALAGASRRHNVITGNVFGSLHQQLRRGPCEVYVSDMKVKSENTGLYTYPDLVVVCGTLVFDDPNRTVLLNPTVIIEVLSPSTESYDRGKKFRHYRTIGSLQEYVLVAQDLMHIEHYLRSPDGTWRFSSATSEEPVLTLPSIGCALNLADVYEKVEFDSGESETGSEPPFRE